jgi:hypothetical protein
MKSKKLIYILLLVIVGVGAVLFVVLRRGVHPTNQTQAEQIAEQIILSYIEAKGLDIHPGTEEYANLMKGILLGEHPDLTGKDSIFVTSDIERDYVIDYAAVHMNLEAEKISRWI